MGGTSGGVLAAARERVRGDLERLGVELEAEGMPTPSWSGKLIRPVLGLAGADGSEPASEVWRALASVQLAHEASLLHDDVIDGASKRRGRPTVVASRGVAAALVEGDHLLTSAYRMAAGTGNVAWVDLFARAVERTVAGEKAQAKAAGRVLEWPEYEAIVLGKSGELVGAAYAAAATLADRWDAHRFYELGRRVGLVYQMLDDLLDYCGHVETGKPSLADYRRGLWTWPRLYVELEDGLDETEVMERLRRPGPSGRTPLEHCLERIRAEIETVRAEARALAPSDRILPALLDDWRRRADDAARPRAAELPPVAGWEELMAEHARSFSFAARLFPAEYRDRVRGVYAWCRYTDDLVDGVDLPADVLEARLDAWLDLSRRAYAGEATGNVLADRVMGEMREAEVPFGYAAELIEGMRMDLRDVHYGTVAELWRYTFRVASVVGLWMTELFGVRDPWMLDRAASLGHAMQLTNILRDVGEDLAAGRLYLPTSWLKAHGLDRGDLERMARTGRIDDRYRSLIERLLQVAEAEYDHARPAIARLPDFYRRPVAVAADVYRGIHDQIRANDYDNLNRRAYTGLLTKLRLGAGALLRSRSDEASAVARTAAALALAGVMLAAPATAQGGVDAADETRAAAPVVAERVVPAARAVRVDRIERGLARLGRLWVDAVEDEAAVGDGLALVARLRSELGPERTDDARLLRAYRGAFLALRAKHGSWPPARVRDLREGLALMDAAVAEAPDAPKLRYLRLMSDFYLPAIFGRRGEVAEDLDALARLLPSSRSAFPVAAFPEIVRFVLENGALEPSERERLESLLP